MPRRNGAVGQAVGGQVGEERVHLRLRHVLRVADAVVEDEPAGPVEVRGFGPAAEVADAAGEPEAIEHGLRGNRLLDVGCGWGGVDWVAWVCGARTERRCMLAARVPV